jgi:oligosaccharide reducing-end xylanase
MRLPRQERVLRFLPVAEMRRSRWHTRAGLGSLLFVFWSTLSLAGGCTSTTDSLGFNDLPVELGGKGGASGGTESTAGADDGGADASGGTGLVASGGTAGGGTAGGGTAGGGTAGGGNGGSGNEAAMGGETSGTGGEPPVTPGLEPLVPPLSYPNLINDVIGVTEKEIDDHIAAVYDQLFHGAAEDQPIFYVQPNDDTQGYIRDILHNDIRTEGLGLGMLISVQLNRREEFDQLWRYSKAHKLIQAGDSYSAGYYNSVCDIDNETKIACIDPYGMQQFAMALIFAHNRWKSDDTLDYEADALELLDVFLHKQDRNGGIVEGVTNMFSAETKLTFDEPKAASASFTRPSIEMPAYYELWYQATGNPFWSEAATAARDFFALVAHRTTGLMPRRAYLDGGIGMDPIYNTYGPEAYRVMLNVALDQIWTRADVWGVNQCNKVIDFFDQAAPGTIFNLDGTVVDPAPEPALTLANGSAAAAASASEARDALIRYVWNFEIPTGETRYYHGLLHLHALLVLSGRMQVL